MVSSEEAKAAATAGGTPADVIALVSTPPFLAQCLKQAKLDPDLIADVADACDLNALCALALGMPASATGVLAAADAANSLFLMTDEAERLLEVCRRQCLRAGVKWSEDTTYVYDPADEWLADTAAGNATASTRDLRSIGDPPSASRVSSSGQHSSRPSHDGAPSIDASDKCRSGQLPTASLQESKEQQLASRQPATATKHPQSGIPSARKQPAASHQPKLPSPTKKSTPLSMPRPIGNSLTLVSGTPSGDTSKPPSSAKPAVRPASAAAPLATPAVRKPRPASAAPGALLSRSQQLSVDMVGTPSPGSLSTRPQSVYGRRPILTPSSAPPAAPLPRKPRPASALSTPATPAPSYSRPTAASKAAVQTRKAEEAGQDPAAATASALGLPSPSAQQHGSESSCSARSARRPLSGVLSGRSLTLQQAGRVVDNSPDDAKSVKKTMFAHISSSLLRPTKAFLAWTGNGKAAEPEPAIKPFKARPLPKFMLSGKREGASIPASPAKESNGHAHSVHDTVASEPAADVIMSSIAVHIDVPSSQPVAADVSQM